MAILKKVEGDEFHLYMNGNLIYKRWLKTGQSKVFDVMAYDKYTLLSITDENIDIQEEVIDYLFQNYTHLMNLNEATAWKNFMLDSKLQIYQPSSEEYITQVNSLKINTPVVKKLMANGFESFKLNWIKRILAMETDKIIFNRCKKYSGLARTPRARQCRFCGNDWHNEAHR